MNTSSHKPREALILLWGGGGGIGGSRRLYLKPSSRKYAFISIINITSYNSFTTCQVGGGELSLKLSAPHLLRLRTESVLKIFSQRITD